LSIYSRIQNTRFSKTYCGYRRYYWILGVDEASGIMFTKSDGAPFGVQLSTVFHDVLTVPFQVSVSISLLLNPTSKLPKAEGNKVISMPEG
jgi:hypothetical protein